VPESPLKLVGEPADGFKSIATLLPARKFAV
jgi:hypothetical protein